MRSEIIRDFQACLNEGIEAGRQNKLIGIPHTKAVARGKLGLGFYNGYREDEIRCSYNDLFFGQSGFLEMIEWKEQVFDYISINGDKLVEGNTTKYHRMQLSILESDELRMSYVLQNMKGFITKK